IAAIDREHRTAARKLIHFRAVVLRVLVHPVAARLGQDAAAATRRDRIDEATTELTAERVGVRAGDVQIERPSSCLVHTTTPRRDVLQRAERLHLQTADIDRIAALDIAAELITAEVRIRDTAEQVHRSARREAVVLIRRDAEEPRLAELRPSISREVEAVGE